MQDYRSPLLEEENVYKNGSSPSKKTLRRGLVLTSAIAALALTAAPWIARAEQPPPPCHPNPLAAQLANRPHSQLPTQAYAEADKSSQLFQYYLLDTNGFQPNVFTRIFPGINDQAQLSVTGGKLRTADSGCGAPRAGAQARAANGS